MNLLKFLFPAVLSFLQLTAAGQTTTLTLDNVPSGILCNETWTEQNLDLSFVSGTSDDCGPDACFFGVEPTYVWLYPSRLTIDLSSLQNIQHVEVDVVSYCGAINPQCTFAFLLDSTGMTLNNVENTINNVGESINGTPETLILENPTEGFISELAISSCEGQVYEIRVYQDITSNIQITSNNEAWTIYPNPAIDIVNIDVSDNLKYEVTIFDLQGRLQISATDQSVIDIQTLPQGIYLIEIKDLETGQKVIEKIIKGK